MWNCIKTRSLPASLPLKGQVTKQTTVKWSIVVSSILKFPGSCQEITLESVKPSLIAGKYHFRIDTPFGKLSLFEDPDAMPVYQGKATARGIKCDVWKQTRVNWPGEYNSRMIWRWYFTQSPQQPVRSLSNDHFLHVFSSSTEE